MIKAIISASLLSLGANSVSAECLQAGNVVLPLSESLRTIAIQLDFNSPMDQRILPQLEGMSSAERDATLLALLQWHTISTLAVFNITMYKAAPLFTTYLATLDRNQLTDSADALRHAQAAFPVWDTTPPARYAQWIDGKGKTDPVLDAKLRTASEDFNKTLPEITSKAEELALSDPDFAARLFSNLAQTPPEARFTYLADRISSCLQEADDYDQDLSELPLVLRNAYFANLFILEAGNGSSHQYFYNSTGDDAPNFLTTLQTLNLVQESEDFAKAIALFGETYPVDTTERRKIIETCSDEQNDALAQPTWIMDTGAFYDALFQSIQASGYWPTAPVAP